MAFWVNETDLAMYRMVEMHIHAPSEHTFDGVNYDLELQITYQNYVSNSIAITAIVFDHVEGGDIENGFIDSLQLDEENPIVEDIPLHHLMRLVNKEYFYQYQGSLTTPPCTEGV